MICWTWELGMLRWVVVRRCLSPNIVRLDCRGERTRSPDLIQSKVPGFCAFSYICVAMSAKYDKISSEYFCLSTALSSQAVKGQ